MRKKLIAIILCLSVISTMLGCAFSAKSNVTYTYNVETGDTIKIRFDTSGKYRLTPNLPFAISHDGDTLSQGTFLVEDGYQQYVDIVNEDEDAILLDSGTKNGNEYIFWSYNDSEFNYAIMIKDSNTGLLIGNNVSQDSAEECFKRMEIKVAN